MTTRAMIINRANPPTAPPMMYGLFDVNSENDLRCKLLSIPYIIYIQQDLNSFNKALPYIKQVLYFSVFITGTA